MSGILYSAHSQAVKATCGHEENTYIPPNGGRPGPVGRRNIEEALSRPCYNCRTNAPAVSEYQEKLNVRNTVRDSFRQKVESFLQDPSGKNYDKLRNAMNSYRDESKS